MSYLPIITDAFKEAFDLTPFGWQVSVIEHLLNMWNINYALPQSIVFLSQPTGSYKSMYMDAYAAIVGDTTWSLSQLLPLQTDQASKLNNYSNVPIISINLDEYKASLDRMSNIAIVLSTVTFEIPTLYIIFCSQQLITTSAIVLNMFWVH